MRVCCIMVKILTIWEQVKQLEQVFYILFNHEQVGKLHNVYFLYFFRPDVIRNC